MLSMCTYMDKHKTQTTTSSEKKEHATHMRAIIYDGVIDHIIIKQKKIRQEKVGQTEQRK